MHGLGVSMPSTSLDAPTQIWSPAKVGLSSEKPMGMAWLLLPDPELTIDEGDMIMLTGSAGAGKSALLEKIASRARQQWGWMGQAGLRLGEKNSEHTRPLGRCCAMVHSESYFDPRKSILANVRLPIDIAGLGGPRWSERLQRAMELLDLPIDDERMGPMQDLYPELRQRVGWARALACDPQLLLVDEAMFCLREATKKRLLSEIKDRVSRGGTVVWATQGVPSGLETGSFRWLHLKDGAIARDERLVKESVGASEVAQKGDAVVLQPAARLGGAEQDPPTMIYQRKSSNAA